MRLLLDTHCFLWFILNDPQLSQAALASIEDPANEVQISPASHWEIAIKIGLGRYRLPQSFESFLQEQLTVNQFTILPIEIRHTARLSSLPQHHRDPFDRLLVVQALVEGIAVASCDRELDAYGIKRIW